MGTMKTTKTTSQAERLKADILAELHALEETGIRNTAYTAARVRAGDFDQTIADLECISSSEAADLILELSGGSA